MDCRGAYCCCFVFLLAGRIHADVKLLSCHSVNVIPEHRPTEYVFIATKKEDCTFVFEGPENTILDMEVRSVSFPKRFTDPKNCRKSKLTIYNYVDSRVLLGKLVCNENEKANLLTKSNMGIITSSLTDGSFSIKIRPKTEDRLRDGMLPPPQTAEDYFFSAGDAEGFKPSPGGFKPSLPLEHSKPFLPSGFYPGRPTAVVDITYNATGHNFTIITHKPTTPLQGAEETTVLQPTAKPPKVSTTSSSLPSNGTKPTSQGKPTVTSVVAQTSVAASTEHLEEE